MEDNLMGRLMEVRFYTGNGFEDFAVDCEVKGIHIFSEANNNLRKSIGLPIIRKVESIKQYDDCIIVSFDTGEHFEYYGLTYRHGGFI